MAKVDPTAEPNPPIEALRRDLVARLTSRDDTAWTVTGARFIVRRGGRVLCKVGRDEAHVLVEFPLPRAADDVLTAIAAAPFVHPAPPGAAEPIRWRQARLSGPDQLDALLRWLL
jgi:uncharacterized protein (DUF1330 family)